MSDETVTVTETTEQEAPTPADMPNTVTEPTPEPAKAEQPAQPADTDWKEAARKHEGRYKKAQKQIAAIARDLGVDVGSLADAGESDKPDANEIAGQLTAAQSDAAAARTELTIYRAAVAAGVDPDTLTDSRRFMDSIGQLDPTAGDYTKQVGAAIAAAKESSPHLQPARARTSGTEITGTPKTELPNDPAALAALINAKRKY